MGPACETLYLSPLITGTDDQEVLKIDFLKQVRLFRGIRHTPLQRIAQDIIPRRFDQGSNIFHEGDQGQVLYFLRSGLVRIFVSGNSGAETTLILYGHRGDMFGELAAIDGRTRSATAMALRPTVLYALDCENLHKHIQQYPRLAVNLINELSLLVRYNTQQVYCLSSLSIAQRLAHKLLELSRVYGLLEAESVHIDLPLTQDDLASLIGTTRESINKNLRYFQRHGWVRVQYKHVTILKLEALQTLAFQNMPDENAP